MIEIIGAILIIFVIPIALWDANNGFVVRWRRLGLLAAVLIGMAFLAAPAGAHDHNRPDLDPWYSSVQQPDTGFSCCGLSDAYWCNEGSKGPYVYCVIDDDRDNEKLKRYPVPNGTVIFIPAHKFNKDPNPTGRAVVWLAPVSNHVFCFVGVSGS